MKNVILAVLAIAALTTAGIGGVFADFSDIEVSQDNYFQSGSLDLAVSNYLGVHYNGSNIPVFWEIADAWPGCDKSVFFDLENVGQGFQVIPSLYIHFKNFDCYWVQPKDYSTIWVDATGAIVKPPANAPGPGQPQGTLPDYPCPKTEPEYVAELGGLAGELKDGTLQTVPGIGLGYGERCQLKEHIGVFKIEIAGPYPDEIKPKTSADVPAADWKPVDLSAYDENKDGHIKLNELECNQALLVKLPCNEGIWVHVSLVMQDFDEEDAYTQGLIPRTYFEDTYPEAKWDHWPTNAMQKDGVTFDIAFELLQNAVP